MVKFPKVLNLSIYIPWHPGIPEYNGLAAPKLHPETGPLTCRQRSSPPLQSPLWRPANGTTPSLPGLILRVGDKRRTWQFRYHAGGSYHRKPLGHFPAMELAEARDAARKLIERADKGVPIEARHRIRARRRAHARRRCSTSTRRCACGKAADQDAGRGDAAAAA